MTCIACHRTSPPPRPQGCGPWCLPPLQQPAPRRADFSAVAFPQAPGYVVPDTPLAKLAAIAAWADEHAPRSTYPRQETTE